MKDKENILEKKIRESIEKERTEFPDDEPESFSLMNVLMIFLAISIIISIVMSFI